MAIIILGKTECALCNEVIEENDEIVSTTHFITDPKDPLWSFSDAGMHKTCFLGWDQRLIFVQKYNQTVGIITWGNGTYHHMTNDGAILSLNREESNKVM